MRTYATPMILANWARPLALRFMTPRNWLDLLLRTLLMPLDSQLAKATCPVMRKTHLGDRTQMKLRILVLHQTAHFGCPACAR